ncbi:MAG: hypothetical protein RL219_1403 [Actinomycetota bacterium]|jgi:hypothetical protein
MASGTHTTAVMTPSDFFSPAQLLDRARYIESLGYDAMWITDMFGREIYITAGFILANTERLRVASGVAHIYGRDAIASAQAGLTLSELSGGRFIQGVGVSHPIAAEMRGLEWENPMDKARAYISAMRSQTTVNVRGAVTPVPIFLAAHGPKMLAVAAEVADGANTYMQTTDRVAEARSILGSTKQLNLLVPMCLTTDPSAGREAGRRAISMYLPLPAYQRVWRRSGFDESDWSGGGSDRLIDAHVPWGSIDSIRARLGEFRDAGADHIVVAASPDPQRPETANELLEALAPGR